MTTKTEQSAGATDAGVAIDSAGAAEPSSLPSIIVDAKALAAAETGAEAPASESSVAATDASAPPADAAGAASTEEAMARDEAAKGDASEAATAPEAVSTERDPNADATDRGTADAGSSRGNGAAATPLTDFEAERFANTFRASWEPGQALDAPMPVTPVSSVPAGPGAVASEHPGAIEPLLLPGGARSRGLLLTAAAVAAFAALVALAFFRTSEPAVAPGAEPEQAAHAADQPPAIDHAPAEAQPALPALQPTAVAAAEPPVSATVDAAGAAAQPLPVAGAAGAAPTDPAVLAAPPETAAAALPVAEPAPAVMPAAVAAPEPAPRIETVRIRLATTPKDATLSIDGITVPNPYDQLLPKGGKHRVSASAPDHETREQLVDFERKRDLVLRLPRLPATRPAAVPTPAPAPVAKAPRPARPAAPRPAARTPKKVSSTEAPAKGAAFVSESPY